MSYSVRHQFFVSSTFTDLIEERTEVIQALWELDCIPTGMEAFVASNESQWEVIRKVIDECDYYVLIIGGRYGSVTVDGVSYTEKEYRYAKKVGLPVLAFVHARPDDIPAGKSELVEENRKKLEGFRAEVMAEHPVRTWSSASELGGLVSRSVVREIKASPRPGWIRNDGTSPITLLERINTLTEENRMLRDSLVASTGDDPDPTLESGNDVVSIYGRRKITENDSYSAYFANWEVATSWNDIFRDVGPSLINETTEDNIKQILVRFHVLDRLPSTRSYIGSPTISPESFNEVIIQLRALGLIDQGVRKRGVADRASYWRITPLGDKLLVSLLARRKASEPTTKHDDLTPQ